MSVLHRPPASAPLVCQQLVELVSDYLDGALGDLDRRRVEDHLAGCDGCTAYVDQVRDLLRLTAGVGPERRLPEPVMRTLRARFQERRPPRPGRH